MRMRRPCGYVAGWLAVVCFLAVWFGPLEDSSAKVALLVASVLLALIALALLYLSFPALIGDLRHNDAKVRRRAAAALGRWRLGRSRREAALRGLIDALGDDAAPVRQAAVLSLGWLRRHAAGAADALAEALSDPAPDVRGLSAWALGEIAAVPAKAVPALSKALGDKSATVRANALYALARTGTAAGSVLPHIRKAMDDPDASVRKAATRALRKLGVPATAERPPEGGTRTQ